MDLTVQNILIALQETPIVEALRLWRWAYPLVNAGHLLGVALLFGAITPLDLRLLGLWSAVPIQLLVRVLVPVAGVGLALALTTGPLLFLTDPLMYGQLWLFWLKLTLVVIAGLNVMWVHRSRAWQESAGNTAVQVIKPSIGLRLAGLASLFLWLGVILCGRLLAYV